MSSTNIDNEEDDWEKIELNLQALTMTEEKPLVPSKPVILARPTPPWPGSQQAQQQTPMQLSTPPPLSTRDEDEPVDSALVTAMENQREKMILFQIEDSILTFVKSNERSMDIPPGLNGFRRMLAYRVAQRFNLSHATSDTIGDNGEKVITLYKTPETCLPKTLLIDMKLPSDSNDETSKGDISPVAGNNAAEPPKKMMVMKRNPNPVANTSNKGNSGKQQLSAEDREKAYLEARARIFGESAAAAEASKEEGNSLTGENALAAAPAAENITVKDAAPLPKVTSTSSLTGADSSNAEIRRQAGSNTDLKNLDAGEQDSSRSNSGSRKGKQVDVGSWKGSKGQVRNLEAEKNDPDFARRSNVSSKSSNRGGGYYNKGSGGERNYSNNNDRGGGGTQYYGEYYYEGGYAGGRAPQANVMNNNPPANPYYPNYSPDVPFLPPPPPPVLVTPNAPYGYYPGSASAQAPASGYSNNRGYDERNMYPQQYNQRMPYSDEQNYTRRNNNAPQGSGSARNNSSTSLEQMDFPPLS